MGRSYQIGMIATALLVAVAAAFFWPMFARTAVRGVQTKNLSNAKQLAIGCRLYAMDHGGRFPLHLSELEPDYIPAGWVDQLRCTSIGRDGEPGFAMDWLYFGAGFDDQNPPRLLIVSPQADTPARKQKRVIVEGDTSGRVIDEADYPPLLKETVQQMRKSNSILAAPLTERTQKAAAH